MKYETPELDMVGAASALIQGGIVGSDDADGESLQQVAFLSRLEEA